MKKMPQIEGDDGEMWECSDSYIQDEALTITDILTIHLIIK